MLLRRTILALSLLTPACASTRDEPSAAPAAPPPDNAQIVATRLPVAYHDPMELARVLHDLFVVRPDRGDVRVILADRDRSALLVFTTPEGLDAIRRVLGPTLTPPPAAL